MAPTGNIPINFGGLKGMAVHWPGQATTPNDHSLCDDLVRGEQANQMNSRGYRDIAYNALICKHGYVYEGRWFNDQSGSNGTTAANQTYFAVSFLVGEQEKAPDVMWAAFRDIRALVLQHAKQATDVQPHSHFVADQCPGDYLRADIAAKKYVPPTPAPAPAPVKPSVSLSKLIVAAKKDPPAPQGYAYYKAGTLIVEKALLAEKLLASTYVDGSFGTKTVAAYAAWQRHLGYSGSAADGIPGATSLKALGARHGFVVTT